jgi:ABC-type transporter Mla subunit MlaD
MRIGRGGRAALAVALAAGVLAGCGSGDTDDKNAYVDEVNQAQQRFADTFEELSGQITSTSTPNEDRKTLRGFEAAIDKTAGELEAVDPPGDVAELHTQLVDEMRSYGEAVGTFREAVGGDLDEVTRAQTTLATKTSQTSSEINRTIDRINQTLRE